MFRKLSLAAVAALAMGGAALAPTPAAAWGWNGGWHGGWHGGFHPGWRGPGFYAGGPGFYGEGGCFVRRVVPTPWGPQFRVVNRCY